jgi:hypothetical protein
MVIVYFLELRERLFLRFPPIFCIGLVVWVSVDVSVGGATGPADAVGAGSFFFTKEPNHSVIFENVDGAGDVAGTCAVDDVSVDDVLVDDVNGQNPPFIFRRIVPFLRFLENSRFCVDMKTIN